MKKNALLAFILLALGIKTVYGQSGVGFRSDIDVLHYDIGISITDLSKQLVEGNTQVVLRTKKAGLDSVSLDLAGFKIDSVFLNGKPTNKVVHKNNVITLFFDKAINTTDTIRLRVKYSGKPTQDIYWGGLFIKETHAFNMGVGMGADPHAFGRVWFPCNDTLTDRALYDFHITVAPNHVGIANGTWIKTDTLANKNKTYHWKLNDSIPTYLACFAISDYVPINGTYKGIEREIPTVLYVNAVDTANARKSASHLNDMMACYEKLFGKYVWEKVGYVSVPFAGGAMEHATCVSISRSAFDSTYRRENLISHELSHHWFGNLVTAKTSEDMWLNEGWARYCEALFVECYYGKDAFKDYMRDLQQKSLRLTHIEDGGFFAVSGVNYGITYGSTVYDKGALVAHTLRGYLGDSLFFNGMKSYLQKYAFGSATSYNLRDYLTQYTGVDLKPFFDGWVFAKGFPHYGVDSFAVSKVKDAYNVRLYIQQRFKTDTLQKPIYKNRIEVAFWSADGKRYDDKFELWGERGIQTFVLPFEPVSVWIDPEEKLADATTDSYRTIKKNGLQEFSDCYFQTNITKQNKPTTIRVTHHWIPADGGDALPDGLALSNARYWTIDVIGDVEAVSGFFYSASKGFTDAGFLDYELVSGGSIDNIVLLYRKNQSDTWKEIPTTRQGSASSGFLVTNSLKQGEYALGYWYKERYNDNK